MPQIIPVASFGLRGIKPYIFSHKIPFNILMEDQVHGSQPSRFTKQAKGTFVNRGSFYYHACFVFSYKGIALLLAILFMHTCYRYVFWHAQGLTSSHAQEVVLGLYTRFLLIIVEAPRLPVRTVSYMRIAICRLEIAIDLHFYLPMIRLKPALDIPGTACESCQYLIEIVFATCLEILDTMNL
ncbi:hypothetical protein ACJX0J_005608 [Zea mays]